LHAGSEDEFEQALRVALNTSGRPGLINVHLNAGDASPAMRRLAQHLGRKVNG
jgi:indolepyruvate decarboxylase